MKAVCSDRAPEAIGPYSQAIDAGELVFCSGQLGINPETGDFVGEDPGSQTEQALRNLAMVLQAAGLALSEVIKTTVYVTDISAFATVNEAYARAFGEHKPARACVEVAALPKGGCVEIECIAARNS